MHSLTSSHEQQQPTNAQSPATSPAVLVKATRRNYRKALSCCSKAFNVNVSFPTRKQQSSKAWASSCFLVTSETVAHHRVWRLPVEGVRV